VASASVSEPAEVSAIDARAIEVSEVYDRPGRRRVVSRTDRFDGKVLGLRTDEVDLGGETVVRDVVMHPGAVGVIALDDEDRVLFVHQYRHPVASLLWEPPAGLLDIEGEDPLDAVKRELYEEAGFRAATWHVLVDMYNSPGGSDEAIRVYLARDLTPVGDSEKHVGEAEERDMPLAWVPLADAVAKVLAGELHNPCAVSGVLAAALLHAEGWRGLRPANAAWERPTSRGSTQPT
jgi:8-oxo-dGTP pyrophosphatase MutT (NUDIX family)